MWPKKSSTKQILSEENPIPGQWGILKYLDIVTKQGFNDPCPFALLYLVMHSSYEYSFPFLCDPTCEIQLGRT